MINLVEAILSAQQQLQAADAILISASNGLSIAEGYHIFADDANFKHYFNDFREKYGFQNLIQGLFSPLPEAEHQAYMTQVRRFLIEDYQPTDVFKTLKEIIDTKPYFVVTSNADTHFQLNGYAPSKLWEIEGNFAGLEERSEPWQAQYTAFQNFTQQHADDKVVQLELGIGANNQLIKMPMMQLVAKQPTWQFITLNLPQAINILPQITDRSLAVTGDIKINLQAIAKGMAR